MESFNSITLLGKIGSIHIQPNPMNGEKTALLSICTTSARMDEDNKAVVDVCWFAVDVPNDLVNTETENLTKDDWVYIEGVMRCENGQYKIVAEHINKAGLE